MSSYNETFVFLVTVSLEDVGLVRPLTDEAETVDNHSVTLTLLNGRDSVFGTKCRPLVDIVTIRQSVDVGKRHPTRVGPTRNTKVDNTKSGVNRDGRDDKRKNFDSEPKCFVNDLTS